MATMIPPTLLTLMTIINISTERQHQSGIIMWIDRDLRVVPLSPNVATFPISYNHTCNYTLLYVLIFRSINCSVYVINPL